MVHIVRVITTTTFGPPVAITTGFKKTRKGSRGARPTPPELEKFGEESRLRRARQESEIRRGQVRAKSVVFKPSKVDLPDISKVTLDPVAISLGITATSSAAIARKLRDIVKQTGKSVGQVSKERKDILDQISALKKQETVSKKLTVEQTKLLAQQKDLKDVQSVLSSKEFLTEQDVILFNKQVTKFGNAKASFEAAVRKSNKEFETLQRLARTGLLAAQAGRLSKAKIERKRLEKLAEDLGIEFKELERRGIKIEDLKGAKFKGEVIKAIKEEMKIKVAPLEKVKVDKFDLAEQIKDISGIPKALVETVVSTPERVKRVFEAEIKSEFKGKPLAEFIGGAVKFPVAGLEATVGTFALGAEKFFERVFPRGVSIKVSTGKLKAFREAREVLPEIPVVGKFFEEPIKGIITKKGEIEISRKTAPTVGFVAPLFVGIPGLKTIPKGFKAATKIVSKTKTGLESVVSKVKAKLPPKPLTKLEIRKIVQEAAREPPTIPLVPKKTVLKIPRSGKGPEFPLTFKIKEPSFEGLKPVKPTKGKPPTLDIAGLTKVKVDQAAARLKAATLKEQQAVFLKKKPEPKIFKETPFAFKDFSSQQQKTTTITKQKIKTKKFKETKTKPIAFEPSTQEFVPSTQKFKKRFFQETEARPLQEFVPKEAGVPKTVRVPIAGVKTTFIEDTKLVEGLIPKIGTIQIAKEFEKFKTEFKQPTKLKEITSVRTKTGELLKSASKQAELLKPALKKAEALKLKSPQRILTRTITKILTRTPVKPLKVTRPTKPKKIVKPKVPPIILLGDKDAFGIEKKLVQGYRGFALEDSTKKPVWVEATRQPRPEAIATEKGFKAADKTISQRVQVRKVRQKVPAERKPLTSLKNKFRVVSVSPKKKTFIERRAFAIDSFGEKEKLKVTAFLARQRKSALGLPLRKTKGFKKSKSLKDRKTKRRFL